MSECKRGSTQTHKKEKTTFGNEIQQNSSALSAQQPLGVVKEWGEGGRKALGQGQMGDVRFVLTVYIPVRIIQQVENNNTRECSYLLFHLPFTLLLCDTLQLHHHAPKTLLFNILLEQIRRLQELNAKPPRQFPPEEVTAVVASAVNFEKVPRGHFLRQLAAFVEKYSVKLSTFLPYYNALFRLVLRRDAYINKQTSVEQLNELLSSTISEVRAKYHNFDLQ